MAGIPGEFLKGEHGKHALLDYPLLPSQRGLEFLGPRGPGALETFQGPLSEHARAGLEHNELQALEEEALTVGL